MHCSIIHAATASNVIRAQSKVRQQSPAFVIYAECPLLCHSCVRSTPREPPRPSPLLSETSILSGENV